jgi:predicted phosphoribosyltransferase
VDGAAEPAEVLDFLAAQMERLRQRRADAEAARDARAARQRARRRWGTDPAAAVLRALVIDDGAAVGAATLARMRTLQRQGYAVSFAAAGVLSDGAEALERAGIACWRRPAYASVEDVLRRQAGCFDLILLPGPSAAASYRALASQYCPRARIVCGSQGSQAAG